MDEEAIAVILQAERIIYRAGSYRSAQKAAEALARACGKLSPRIPGHQET
jgi:hypothetical protein